MDYENFKSWEQVDELGIRPRLIKNLHAKLYFSEKAGIVTSMNLLSSSKARAIEFGSRYDLNQELEQLKFFIKNILEPNIVVRPNDDELYFAKEKFVTAFRNCISYQFERQVSCRYKNERIEFNMDNIYYISLDKVSNIIAISGIISGAEHGRFQEFNVASKKPNVSFDLYDNCIVTTINKSFSNSNFDFLRIQEKKEIIDITIDFVQRVCEFKQMVYKSRRASC